MILSDCPLAAIVGVCNGCFGETRPAKKCFLYYLSADQQKTPT
jgi:hypothetical protein